MTDQEAIDIVVAQTTWEQIRHYCDPADPAYRPGFIDSIRVAARAEPISRALPPAPRAYPPIMTQLGNATRAAGRVASALVHGHRVAVDAAEQERRLTICKSCEFFDSAFSRCTKCGCFGAFKSWLATEHCPISKW